MLHGAALRQTGTGWEFASEEALEDFLEDNLQELLGLTFLKRQHHVREQYCDILALGKNKQLVILELKNTEDRYVIQQLTRYYDALLDEKPFPEEVDYNQPVELVAIAPNFHRDNLTDIKYHTLTFRLVELAVIKEGDAFYLKLSDLDNKEIAQIGIPYREIYFSDICENTTAPPRLLLDWLGSCTRDEQEGILKIRGQMLNFHSRMQEITESKSIKYGAGKSKPCAEFCFNNKLKKPILFLWLPLPTARQREAIGRMRVWTDGNTVSHVGHVPKGFGRMKTRSEWDAVPVESRPKHMYMSGSSKSFFPVPRSENLGEVVDLALQKWLEKISK